MVRYHEEIYGLQFSLNMEFPYSASVPTQLLQGIQPSDKQGIFIRFVK